MQDLLGRIAALDPEASLGIRVIACFDELIVGRVSTRALLAAASSLAGCAAGCSWADGRTLRIGPGGLDAGDPADSAPRSALPIDDESQVWLEREGAPLANDAIILERLALAVRMRRGNDPAPEQLRRPLGLLLDATEPAGARREAAAKLSLHGDARYRVLVAPLSAVWSTHPYGPSDVIATPYGSVHAVVVDAGIEQPEVSLLGIGTSAEALGLPASFRAALTAVRLASPDRQPVVRADQFGGLVDVLADSEDTGNPDVARLERIMPHSWAARTLDALTASTTLRQAARAAGVHHSTMQVRVDTIADALGCDPLDSFGRTRLTLAYLSWRLRTSTAFSLPVGSAEG